MGDITERMVRFSTDERQRFWRRWMPTLIAVLVLSCLFATEGAIVQHNTEQRVREELSAEYEAKLAAYKEEQARATQAEHWLSGEASREAAINQAVDAVSSVIARLSTDKQKLTEASCILARVMNSAYPNDFEQVCEQNGQWMFYDGTNKTFSEHDRSLADQVVRPFMESGIVPNGLTADYVYGEWSTNDFVLRDSWQKSSKSNYWRWS